MNADKPLEVFAIEPSRTLGDVKKKCNRLGLEVVVQRLGSAADHYYEHN